MTDQRPPRQFVAYFRTSTDRQDNSFEIQKNRVNEWLQAHPQDSVIAIYEEEESGGKKYRPQLLQAIKKCQMTGAWLMFPKADRLARNISVVSLIADSGLKDRVLNLQNPSETWFFLCMSILMAEKELRDINDRIKDTMKLKKERGEYVGPKNKLTGLPENRWTPEFAKKGAQAVKMYAETNIKNVQAGEFAYHMRANKHSLEQIANKLNEIGMTTVNNKQWDRTAVMRLLKRKPPLDVKLPRGKSMSKGHDPRRHPLNETMLNAYNKPKQVNTTQIQMQLESSRVRRAAL